MFMPPKTLYQKIVDNHVVKRIDEEHVLLFIDLHIMNEYTSPQAFQGLRRRGLKVLRPQRQLAIADHVVPTRRDRGTNFRDHAAIAQVDNLGRNCADFGIEHIGMNDPRQGIEHVVAPELGYILPGMVVACGDSHTTTFGALGALGFGIGTSEVEHILATQTLIYRPAPVMKIELNGHVPHGCYAKDVVLALLGRIGVDGARGYAVEFGGRALRNLSVEGRMTLCNMAVEAGARAALINPDDKVFDYLNRLRDVVAAERWSEVISRRDKLRADDEARYDRSIVLDLDAIEPQVTWGTSPDQVVPVSSHVPDPTVEDDPARRQQMLRALDYMGLEPGEPVSRIRIDKVFIGSCTNARIEDLRAAATVVDGKTVASGVQAMVVPGSQSVRRQAEAEGLDRIFREAGFDWRLPGCSMCLAMNDDVLKEGERCASSTNRNFEGRQGRGGRTHLMSPAMAAAAAVAGHIVDVRYL
jgi:3-isopropylmalate/(R)-2-methylmalate dehydratase large subunit